MKSLLSLYFKSRTKAEEREELEPSVLEGAPLQEAISQQFESLYKKYQGLILTTSTLEEAKNLSFIPSAIRNLVEVISEYTYSAIESLGSELHDSEALLQEMSALSGLEEDFLESLCRLSGGSEESLLGVFEAQRERGDGAPEELRTRGGLQGQLQPLIQGMNELYNALQSEDRGHLARRAPFQEWLIAQIQSMRASDADFIASERQYLRIWDRITDKELGKSLLFRAVEQGETAFVRHTLLSHPDWIGLKDTQRYADATLLHLAATQFSHRDIVELLIEHGGADFCNIRDNDGKTALHYAVKAGKKDIIELLIHQGGSGLCKIRDDDGLTALTRAVDEGK